MNELATFWKVLLGICSTLACIWGAVKVLKEIKKPSDDLRAKVADIDSRERRIEEEMKETAKKLQDYTDAEILKVSVIVESINSDLQHVKRAIDDNNKNSQLIMKSVFAIGNHMVSGNDVAKIREANQEIIDHLIEVQ